MNTIINLLMAAAMQVLGITAGEKAYEISEEIQLNAQQIELCDPATISEEKCNESISMYESKIITSSLP